MAVALEERFLSKTIPTLDNCRVWIARRFERVKGEKYEGYGAFRYRGKVAKAHRVSWELFHGPIPPGLKVLHRCDNPPCVNPDHLFLGTVKDNNNDCDSKLRRCKLSKESQEELVQKAAEGLSHAVLAKNYEVSTRTIRRILVRLRKGGN